jgi:hypothetical protein
MEPAPPSTPVTPWLAGQSSTTFCDTPLGVPGNPAPNGSVMAPPVGNWHRGATAIMKSPVPNPTTSP